MGVKLQLCPWSVVGAFDSTRLTGVLDVWETLVIQVLREPPLPGALTHPGSSGLMPVDGSSTGNEEVPCGLRWWVSPGPHQARSARHFRDAVFLCRAAVPSAFDDPNLVAYGGLEPVVRLAERCGQPALVGAYVRLPASKDGASTTWTAAAWCGGPPVLRSAGPVHAGVVPALLFTHGQVKQLHAVARRVPARTGPSQVDRLPRPPAWACRPWLYSAYIHALHARCGRPRGRAAMDAWISGEANSLETP
ncbi:hypothetical protein SAMN04487983_102614 [Streptomyces sp. yr375]|nr:hypothetical protein SAMN04487983_102614 [Streptomyces sp. yr375]